MDVKRAVMYLKKAVPHAEPIAYWERNGSIIFNAPMPELGDAPQCSYYVVDSNGSVTGTNPVLAGLSRKGMKPVR